MQTSMVVFFLAWFGLVTTNEESDDEIHFTNSWAVHIDNGDLDAVNNIAQKHGFINQGQVGTYEYTTTLTAMQRFERVLSDFVFTKALISLLTIERLTYLFCRVKRQDPVALPPTPVVFIMETRKVPEIVSHLKDQQIFNLPLKLVDILISQIGSLPGYYHFVKHSVRERSRRSLDDHSETLLSEPRVSLIRVYFFIVSLLVDFHLITAELPVDSKKDTR